MLTTKDPERWVTPLWKFMEDREPSRTGHFTCWSTDTSVSSLALMTLGKSGTGVPRFYWEKKFLNWLTENMEWLSNCWFDWVYLEIIRLNFLLLGSIGSSGQKLNSQENKLCIFEFMTVKIYSPLCKIQNKSEYFPAAPMFSIDFSLPPTQADLLGCPCQLSRI